ncbi:uncharacterized protein LOC130165997 isoform X2 [Seriola aureovittata]|uniref:uncharacterized protein LOC130165997 isoform X2 n=1 Tax=Seriola aureovittata TaxID=2871759 RepID=UPI0024BEF711|nr:uncharacterized protein LOC130165997 isoform X2 [Seriola aureovittata]
MRRYWWPGFEMQLLGELQRQQNSAQFCDTLLQTEGISVPTHSCILAALSPYLSQKLSASPSPPSGQKHQLQLQAVKAQTLLKLVGLLYSGEVEVKGSTEQNDVLAAARQFGIINLVEGQKDGGMKEGERQSPWSCRENDFHAEESRGRDKSRKMRDAQVQTEMAGKTDTDSPVEKRSCISTGTQTVKAGEKSVYSSITLSSQATPPTPESTPSVAQSLDFSVTLEKQFCSTSCPVIPSMPSGASSDGDSILNRSFCSLINPTSTPVLCSEMLTFPVSLNDDAESPRRQEDNNYKQSSESGDSIQGLAEESTELENRKRNGKIVDNREDREQPSQATGDEMPGEERGKSTEKRCVQASVGLKSLAMMKQLQQVMESTQISIKVKLRRRTKGEMWEVVSMQDTDDALKQDGSNHKRPGTDISNVPPPPSTVQPDCHILQPALTNPPRSQPHPNTSSDSQPPSSDCFTPNQNNGIEAAPLLQPQGSAEESDEQIEKLLEDIMMGLNILPNLERDSKKSHYLQPSHDGVLTVPQIPAPQNDAGHSQMHAGVSAAGCVFYQDLETQSYKSSTDTGIHCCFTAQNQSSCSSLSSVLPDSVLIQQQQESSLQNHSSVRSMWQREGMSHQSMPLSKSQDCLHPEPAMTRSVRPSAFFSAGQKLHYPAFQEASSEDSQHILELLPLNNETQSMHSLCLPCMDDLRLPRCLSPLELCTSSTEQQPALNNPLNLGVKIQQQPSLYGRPWLRENPDSLQFPLSAIIRRENKSAYLPQDTNCSCWSKQCQGNLEMNPESSSAKEVEERERVSAGQQNATELKYDCTKMKDGDTTGAIAPKRRRTRRTSHPQHAAASLLSYKDVKVSDGTETQINLSVCQVSLSSNNVLAKEREMATSSLNIQSKFVRKPNQPSSIRESLREKTRGCGVNTALTRIRTRAFLKKAQESGNTSQEASLFAKPVAHRDKTANKEGVRSQKRGRPAKIQLEELTAPNNNPPAAVVDKNNNYEESQQNMDKNLPKKELEKEDKTEQRCKKRRINRSTEVEVIPLKKAASTENTGNADADAEIISDIRKPGTTKRPQMVTLKEFQNLIKRQHSKMRKSIKSQETNETVRDVKGMVCRDDTCKESTEEIKMDKGIIQPQDRGRSDGSQVTVDENHNHISNELTDENNKSQQDETDDSASKETSSFSGISLFSFDVLEEEVAKLAAEREQPLKNPDEGTTCDTGESNTTQQTVNNDEGLSHSDTHLPQEIKLLSDDNLQPKTPPPDAGGISRTSGCGGEEEEKEEGGEEEEEVEVDVLLYSPVKVPQTRECEDEHNNMEITPDEEEEEDVNEIDVTGDEAE